MFGQVCFEFWGFEFWLFGWQGFALLVTWVFVDMILGWSALRFWVLNICTCCVWLLVGCVFGVVMFGCSVGLICSRVYIM